MSALTKKHDDAPQGMTAGEFAFTSRDFRLIAAIIQEDAGIHLSENKATLVYSRLARRLRTLNIGSFHEYCELISSSTGHAERARMLSALTTNVTKFFRESHHFDHLKAEALLPLIESARRGGRIRIWSAGCSSGQEPYSIALTLLSVAPNIGDLDVKILATDIDPVILAQASHGCYADGALTDIPPALRKRYFSESDQENGDKWRIGPEVRKIVAFRELNLNREWPMQGRFQIIFCRNVAIYFDEPTQQALWAKFASKLEDGGWLYIGHSERVAGAATAKFSSRGVTTYRLGGGATT